jgi:hypothetical protein
VSDYVYFDQLHVFFWYFASTLLVVLVWFATAYVFKIRNIPIYSDFKEIKEESEYIDWILFNEKIVQAAPYVWNYEYQSIGNYYSRTETDHPIHFNGIQMLAFFDFLKNYDKKLSELLGKYNSLSLEEEMEIMQSDPDHDFAEIFNLRFHLKRRATLLEYGVELPLYLRGK